MEKLTKEKIEDIMKRVSDMMDVKFELVSVEDNRLEPMFDVDAIVSKFMALLVYSGLNVPSSFAPPYNRVHADIEFWKKRFESDKPKEEQAPAEGSTTDGAPQS